MKTESAVERCGQPPAANRVAAATLVQQVVVQQSRGWVCEIKRSKHTYYCGMLSYETEVRPIEFMHAQRVHPRECRRWVHQKKFVDPDQGEEHQITVPGVTNVQVAALGQGGNLRNRASCQGGVMSTADGVAMSGLVIEVEYQVSVRRIQIKSIGDEVEAGSHHLPCQFRLGRCVAGNFETYVWNATQTCPFRQLSHSDSATIGPHISMEEHDVELRLEAASPQNQTGCPPLTLHPTEVPHVFAAIGQMATPARHLLAKPTDAEVDPQLEMRVQLATLRHQNRREKQGRQPGCQAAGRAARPAQMVAVAPPRFGAVRGDAFVTFQCTPVNVRLRVATTCYEDIPVYQRHEGEQLFVDVHSRRLKSSSAVTPCSQLWPMLVNGDHQWWQLPELHPAEAPAVAARGEAAQDTLYTAEQLEGWRRAVTFPDERETVPSVLAAGLCRRSTGCPWMEHVDSSFSLSRLEKQVEGGMWHLLLPEPLNSLTNHLQSIVIVIMGCVMLRWGCRANGQAAGMATGPTQVSVEVAASPPPAATADAVRPGALAAIEYQTPQAAAFMAAATAALKQQME